MTYIETRERYGREEHYLDIRRFVGDVAAVMGGTMLPARDGDGFDPHWAGFELEGTVLGFTKMWNRLDRVTVRAAPATNGLSYKDVPSSAEYRLPEAGMSTARPMKALVADIRRRVLEPAKAPIAKRTELALELAAREVALAKRAAWLRGLGFDARLDAGANYNGRFYRSDPHMSGTFYADGTVSLERMGSIDGERFERMIAALA